MGKAATSAVVLSSLFVIIGFHFGPFLILSLGMPGDVEKGFRAGRVCPQVGLGVLIKNDNLVMNSFQLSLAFYPVIPGVGENKF